MTSVVQYAVLGVGVGAIYTLLVQGLVAIYAGSRVLNLAHGAYAMIGAYVYYQLRVLEEWSTGPAVAGAILFTAAIGGLTYQLIMRPLREASGLSKVAATLGILLTIQSSISLIFGVDPVFIPSQFSTPGYDVAGVFVPGDRAWLLGIALAVTGTCWGVARFTRVGLAMRASAENGRAAAALGWSSDRIATMSWAFGAGLAGLAGALIAPIVAPSPERMPLFVIPALAAGLVGGFVSYWWALVGALGIGIIEAEAAKWIDLHGAPWSVSFFVIVVVLLVRGRGLPVRGQVAERLPGVGSGVVRWRWILPAVGLGCYLYLAVFPLGLIGALTGTFATAIIMLSVVVLLGFTGQLSFEQMAMAGLGAAVAGQLVHHFDVPFGLAMVAAVCAAVPFGVAFAIPALRTRGINLAVVTLGLGAVVSNMVLTRPDVGGPAGVLEVSRPTLLGLEIDPIFHPERYGLIVLLAFVICAIAVANIRRGKAGSALIAVRANERAAAALGIDVLGTKLYAFVVGATLAAIGGVLYGFSFPVISLNDFTPYTSILVVTFAVIGGVGFVLGPLIGGTFVAAGFGGWLLERFWSGADEGSLWIALAGGISVVLLLILHPDGAVTVWADAYHKFNRLWRSLRRLPPASPNAPVLLGDVQVVRSRKATLEVRDLVVRFGGVTAVDSVSLSVRSGEIVGLIGPNGAGKTVLIDTITGFTRPSGGELLLDERRINDLSVHQRVACGISRSFQSLELFEDSTLFENLCVASDPRETWRYYGDIVRPGHRPLSASAVAAVGEFGLESQLPTRVSDLSYGHRRLGAIARSIAVNPSILLLDEPAAGLSSTETAELAKTLSRLVREWGIGILVVEHEMAFVMSLCDRVVVLDFGKHIAEGTPAEVQCDPVVIAAYLGDPDPDGLDSTLSANKQEEELHAHNPTV
jgi:ABC-type branched-subunit amino acid transport system ATPase component/branched-subunit amino acid ABC-type transport system permease component